MFIGLDLRLSTHLRPGIGRSAAVDEKENGRNEEAIGTAPMTLASAAGSMAERAGDRASNTCFPAYRFLGILGLSARKMLR